MEPVRYRGIRSHLLVPELTIFEDPCRTEARYRRGLVGVRASLPRLTLAFREQDYPTACDVLGDMAACLGIEVPPYPEFPRNVARAAETFELLFRVSNKVSVRNVLIEVIEEMGLAWTVRKPCRATRFNQRKR